MKSGKSVFIRFLGYVKPYVGLLVLGSIGGIIKFSTPLVFPRIMQYFIDTVFSPTSIMTSSQKIVELNKWTLFVLALYVLVWVPGTFIRHYFTGKAGYKVIYDLRQDLYKHIQAMSASYYNKNQSGGIVSLMMNDIGLAQNLVGNALTNVWMDGSVIIVLLVVLFKMDWVLTCASLSIFPFYIVISKRIGKKVKYNSHMVQEETQDMSANLQEKIGGYTVVQAFSQENFEQKNFTKDSIRLLGYQLKSSKLGSLNNVFTGFLTSIAPIFVFWVGCQRINAGALTLGQLVVFYTYLGHFYLPITRFAELNLVFATSMAALERIFRTLDLPIEIKDKDDALECKAIKGEIEIKDIKFAYDTQKQVLKGIDMIIPAGERIAIVGSSGSGKSTLVTLVPRFYDVSQGEILIDGVNIKDYKLHSLRRNIGMVLQETILFSGTIRDNILYGKLDATQDEIIAAAKAANAYEFIMAMPYGFDTVLGERGAKLSGGQKQRIAITRVFIKNPKILILDEATSALDSESENLIQDALERLMKGRTTIIIAHRLSTVINSDEIVVMSEGNIVERGSHKQLIELDGNYKRLYDAQFNK